MEVYRKRNLFYLWIIFLISPFFAFLIALKKGFNTYYQPIILGFSFLFGYSVFFWGGDILRYAATYEIVKNYSWSDFWFILSHRFDAEALSRYPANLVNRKPDIYALVLQFFVSRFAESNRLFFALVSLIYTKFFLMFLNMVYTKLEIRPKKVLHYVFIVFLIVIIPFYVGVTGIRFWTALFLFIYFVLRYFDTPKFKFIILSGLSLLIHYSFFVPFTILVLFHVVPVKRFTAKILVAFSLLVFFVSSTTSIMNSIEDVLYFTEGTTIEGEVQGYTNEELLDQRKERNSTNNWYVSLRSDSLFYVLILFMSLEFFGILKLNDTDFTRRLYPLLVLFFCLTLLTYHLGSLGRFKNIFYLLTFARYVLIFPGNINVFLFRLMGYILIPVLILYILVTFRVGLYFVDSYLIINNSIGVFFLNSSESISEFLVGH